MLSEYELKIIQEHRLVYFYPDGKLDSHKMENYLSTLLSTEADAISFKLFVNFDRVLQFGLHNSAAESFTKRRTELNNQSDLLLACFYATSEKQIRFCEFAMHVLSEENSRVLTTSSLAEAAGHLQVNQNTLENLLK